MVVNEDQARSIAQKDAEQAYGDLSPYHVQAVERDRTWQITYEFADPLMLGGGPTYTICTETGRILDRIYYQ